MDATLAQILTHLFDLERRLADAYEELAQLKVAAAEDQ